MPLSTRDLVENIVGAILFDLKRQFRLREGWEKIDHISQGMILDDWRTLIRKEIDSHLEKPTPNTGINELCKWLNEQGDALGDLRKDIKDVESRLDTLDVDGVSDLYNWLREIEKRIAALEGKES